MNQSTDTSADDNSSRLRRTEDQDAQHEAGRSGDGEFDPVIPILRTYEGDSLHIAKTKGGTELRSILAREAEEKQKAKEEYLKKTRDVLKESAVLRDTHRNFVKKQKAKQKGQSYDERSQAGVKSVADSVAGALEYVRSVHSGSSDTPDHSAPEPVSKIPADSPESVASHPQTHSPSVRRQSLGASAVRPSEMQEPDTEKRVSDVIEPQEKEQKPVSLKQDAPKKNEGKSDPSEVFTKKERQALREKQDEVVEKETIREAWKSFRDKKERLKEQGFEARDVRSYGVDPVPNTALRRQNIFAVLIVVVLLVGLIAVVVSIVSRPSEIPGAIVPETLQPVRDVVNSENQIFIDMTVSPEVWGSISKSRGDQRVLTEFVPYVLSDSGETQLDLTSFLAILGTEIPEGLLSSFDPYYFAGNYQTKTGVNGLFIVSVKNYGDALVWMLNWERHALNTFSAIFPGLLSPSDPKQISLQTNVVDNKDVRVLTSPGSGHSLSYYFFNRSILVFVVGDSSIIPVVNNRIRATNTL